MTFDDAWDGYVKNVSEVAAILQVRDELRQAWDRIHGSGAQSLLEIGTRNGGSLYILAQALPVGSLIVALDQQQRKTDVINTEQALAVLRDQGYRTEYIIGDSQQVETMRKLEVVMPTREFDVVHIDGDHSWDGAHNDWVNYGQAANMFCLFHDIIMTGQKGKSVVHYWAELKSTVAHAEYRADGSNMGIGMVIFD